MQPLLDQGFRDELTQEAGVVAPVDEVDVLGAVTAPVFDDELRVVWDLVDRLGEPRAWGGDVVLDQDLVEGGLVDAGVHRGGIRQPHADTVGLQLGRDVDQGREVVFDAGHDGVHGQVPAQCGHEACVVGVGREGNDSGQDLGGRGCRIRRGSVGGAERGA
ncbi:hypothetical protein O3S80_12075 [Streptomyces sp. Lzd4kr]|nr:hypothetical protein [Streptomyces sp. Lzd4kr]